MFLYSRIPPQCRSGGYHHEGRVPEGLRNCDQVSNNCNDVMTNLLTSLYKKCLLLHFGSLDWPCSPTVGCPTINWTLVYENKLLRLVHANPCNIFKAFLGRAFCCHMCDLSECVVVDFIATWHVPSSLWNQPYVVFAIQWKVKHKPHRIHQAFAGAHPGTDQVFFGLFREETGKICQ